VVKTYGAQIGLPDLAPRPTAHVRETVPQGGAALDVFDIIKEALAIVGFIAVLTLAAWLVVSIVRNQ
jgi:hypothetical protein